MRRLQKKYGAETDQIFATAVKKGRQAKGMPAWDGMLEEPELALIKKYIDSVQEKE